MEPYCLSFGCWIICVRLDASVHENVTCLGHVLLAEAREGPHLGDAGVIGAQPQALRPHPGLEAAGCLVVRVVTGLYQIIDSFARRSAIIRFKSSHIFV